MVNHLEQIETKDSARLQKIPDSHTQGPCREDNGRAYSSFFVRLQIKPESHESFFHFNLKPFRNKDARLKLLAKGDEESLQQLSEMCLTALGKIVWAKERNWLLTEEELPPTEKPLWYILPKDRKPGDHDRFFEILEPLWKRMRNNIFEVRPVKPTKSAAQAKKGPVKAAKPTRRRKISVSRGKNISCTSSPAAHGHETAPPQRWLQDRLEDAIQDIVTTMEEARRNSHPEMFSRIWQAQMARLVEYEQYEKQEVDTQSLTQEESISQNGDPSDAPGTVSSQATDDEDTTMVDTVAEAEAEADPSINNDSLDELQADQASSSEHQSIPPTMVTTPTSDRIDAQPQPQPHSQQLPPPTLPTTTYPYLPPSLPRVLSAYITPFSPTTSPNTSSDQPYLWPDAPCHETSYPAFRSGVRLRADVPDRIGDDKLGLVIAYAWNDSCRAVMSGADWRNGFVEDLRSAARRGIMVWRVRVCCVIW